jgi:ubiquinone biosynthesis protein UbiJ
MWRSAIRSTILVVVLPLGIVGVVRRAKIGANDESLPFGHSRRVGVSSYGDDVVVDQTAQKEGHCVVWGDGPFEGSRFSSAAEANTLFQKMSGAELAVVHYNGLYEVQRYKSRRLVDMDWESAKAWCASDHHESFVKHAPVAIESTHRSFFEKADVSMPRHQPVGTSSSSFGASITSSIKTKTAALSMLGKVELLEQEMSRLGSDVSNMLMKLVGTDTGLPAASWSAFEVGAASGGHVASMKSHEKFGKLMLRLESMEGFALSMSERIDALETEIFGSTTSKSRAPRKNAEASFSKKIQALTSHADVLRSRLDGLTSSGLMRDISKVEDKMAVLGPKAAFVFKTFGSDGTAVAEKATAFVKSTGGNLKDRLIAMDEYTVNLLRIAAVLGSDVIGNSWSLPAQSSEQAHSIKEQTTSLSKKLDDLQSRIAALEAAPSPRDVDKVEGVIAALASRVATLSKSIGIDAKLTDDPRMVLAAKGATFEVRIGAVADLVNRMHSTTASLEDQLTGSIGTMPTQSPKDGFKAKINLLEMQIDNIDSRIAALEKQV